MAGAWGAVARRRPLGSPVPPLLAGGRQGGGLHPKTGRPQAGGGACRHRLVRPFALVPLFVPSGCVRPAPRRTQPAPPHLGGVRPSEAAACAHRKTTPRLPPGPLLRSLLLWLEKEGGHPGGMGRRVGPAPVFWPVKQRWCRTEPRLDPSPPNGGRAPGAMAGARGAAVPCHPRGSPVPRFLARGRQGEGPYPKTERPQAGGRASRPAPASWPALWWPDPSSPSGGRAPRVMAITWGAVECHLPLVSPVPPFRAGRRQGGGLHPMTARLHRAGRACRPAPASRPALWWPDPSPPKGGHAPGAMVDAWGAAALCCPLGFLVPSFRAGGRRGDGRHPKTARLHRGGRACRPAPASRPALWWPDPSPPNGGHAPGAMVDAWGAAALCCPLGFLVPSFRAEGRRADEPYPMTARLHRGGGACRPRLGRPFAPVPLFVPSRYARPALGWPDPSPPNGGSAPGVMAGVRGAAALCCPLGFLVPSFRAGGQRGEGLYPKSFRAGGQQGEGLYPKSFPAGGRRGEGLYPKTFRAGGRQGEGLYPKSFRAGGQRGDGLYPKTFRAEGRRADEPYPKTERPQEGGGACRPRLVRPFAPVPLFVPSRYARPALWWPDPSPPNGGRAPGAMAGAWGAAALCRPLGFPVPSFRAGGQRGDGLYPKSFPAGGRRADEPYPKAGRPQEGGGASRPLPARPFALVLLAVPSRCFRSAPWRSPTAPAQPHQGGDLVPKASGAGKAEAAPCPRPAVPARRLGRGKAGFCPRAGGAP